MTNIAFKCDCGWMAVEDPDDLWDDVAQLVDDHVEYCPHNKNDGLGASAKNTTETAVDPNPQQEEQIVKNPTAHLSAVELNRMIHHPVWCARECCVEWEGMGDVWHESRVQTKVFHTNPVRRNQEFDVASKLVRYSVVNEEDSPAGAEITLTSHELDEKISLFLAPATLRDLAQWLLDRANDVDVMCGQDGLA